MKIATWNVNSLKVRLPHLIDWLARESPDVVCLQETKLTDDAFPRAAIETAGYEVAFSGQKTYNGVAILSRSPMTEVETGIPGFADEQKRALAATVAGVRVVCVYVPNGQSLESDKFQYKLAWLAALHDWLADALQRHAQLAVLGDFNIAPEDRDVHDPVLWQGNVLVSDEEREHFQGLLRLGLKDTFRLFDASPGAYSWWDYRQAAFRRNLGLRIDHILASDALAATCKNCRIDTAPRALERPSDHAPVIAGFAP